MAGAPRAARRGARALTPANVNAHAARRIEVVHCYLCTASPHLSAGDRAALRRERNVLYHTSRVAHQILRGGRANTQDALEKVHFIAYLLCLKWLFDVDLRWERQLAESFGYYFGGMHLNHEFTCFRALDFSFAFLEQRPLAWDVYE
jgi:hypothetical protein